MKISQNQFILLLLGGFVAIGAVLSHTGTNSPTQPVTTTDTATPTIEGPKPKDSTTTATTGSAACNKEWRQCKDNSELMNSNNSMLINARVACRMAADKSSKYGNGKWGWGIKFSKFRFGDDYVNTGIMVVADDNVTFPNVYGTPVKSEVRCSYNMKSGEVESVDIAGL